MTKQEKIMPMNDKLHPIGTLMYEDSLTPSGDANWQPHHSIWRVIAHRKCQDFPNAPIKLACELRLLRTEPLIRRVK